MTVLGPGTKLKRGTFEIISLLGSGGFGEVYLARQTRIARDVAIKVLRPQISENAEMVMRFQREALAAANLLHPNVLTVFDFDFDDETGAWFLAMQYVPGGRTLRELLGSPLPLDQTVHLIEGVASALDAAHALGIVHRDVKPENVMLHGSRTLLADFGIAHLATMSGVTAVGMAIGTPGYMSPEQAMGRPVGPASDQYALGVMVYEMLAGRPPFIGDPVSLMVQHTSATPPPLTLFNPSVGSGARAAVLLAMSKNADDRFASCTEFVQSLSNSMTASHRQVRGTGATTVGSTGGPTDRQPATPDEPGLPYSSAALREAPSDPFGLAGSKQTLPSTPTDGGSLPPSPPVESPGFDRSAPSPTVPGSIDKPVSTGGRGLGAFAMPPHAEEPPQPTRASEDRLPPPISITSGDDLPPSALTVAYPYADQPVLGQTSGATVPPADVNAIPPPPVDRAPASSRSLPQPSRGGAGVEPPAGPTGGGPSVATPSNRAHSSLGNAPANGARVTSSGGVSAPVVSPSAGAASTIPHRAGRTRRVLPLTVGVVLLVILVGTAVSTRLFNNPPNVGPTPLSVTSGTGATVGIPATQPVLPSSGETGAAPPRGTVQVTSMPDGAGILVNSEPAGRTPRQLELEPGDYTVVLTAPSYADSTQQIRVADGDLLALDVSLTPLDPIEAVELGPARLGRDPYIDANGIIQIGTVTDVFTIGEDINAIVYLRPKSYRIRDLTFKAVTRWQRAGAPPMVLQADQNVSRDWAETFVRACAPAAAIDARGSYAPLDLEILIDDTVVARFTFRVGPGDLSRSAPSPCDATALPTQLAAGPHRSEPT